MLGPFQAGTGDVRVTTRGDGDVDLYVSRGSAPTTERFDCRSDGDASDEECTVTGNGLKDPEWAISGAPTPITIAADSELAAQALGLGA